MTQFIFNLWPHIWQFPQHTIAWIILSIYTTSRMPDYNGRRVYTCPLKRSMSLGGYIFITEKERNKEAAIAHEYGHSRQSLYFGWLYFLIIGIPSSCIVNSGSRYYEVWCEKWANKLGGVEVVITGTRSCDFELMLKE